MNSEGLNKALKPVGLTIDKQTGAIVKEVGAVVPNGTEINDIYYPLLWQHVVSQEVVRSIRAVALEEGVYVEEDWINGVKEWIGNGLLELGDYHKDVTINDWNPDDNTQIVYKYSIDYTKFVSIKLTQIKIVQAFTNASTLDNFINNIIEQLYNTFKDFFQTIKAKMICQDATSDITITYDKIYDTTDVTDMLLLITLLNQEVEKLKTLSADHLALTDDTFKYSISSLNDLVMVTTPTIKANLISDVIAPLYNSDRLLTSLIKNAKIVDPESAGVDSTTAAGFKFAIFDKRALRLGYQLRNATWTFKSPQGGMITELHNWFGFAVIPNLYKSIWADVPVEPAVVNLTKKISMKPKRIIVKDKIKVKPKNDTIKIIVREDQIIEDKTEGK